MENEGNWFVCYSLNIIHKKNKNYTENAKTNELQLEIHKHVLEAGKCQIISLIK